MAGGMGPGSPEMKAKGKAAIKWIMNGLWAMFDVEQDQFIVDKKVLTWKAHIVVGWDFWAKEYRAIAADSNGSTALFKCEIEGDKFIMTADATIRGATSKASFHSGPYRPERC